MDQSMTVSSQKTSLLDAFLAENKELTGKLVYEHIPATPRLKLAIVSCMDTRLVQMLEDVLGIERGDVNEIRIAGATSDIDSYSSDLVRSLAGAIYLLGVREVWIIGHTKCGLSNIDLQQALDSMRDMDVDPHQVCAQIGGEEHLVEWLGGFHDLSENISEVVKLLRKSPVLPRIPVHGLVIDIDEGKIEVVDRDQI